MKYILTAIAFCTMFSCYGQLEKGRTFITGIGGYTAFHYDNDQADNETWNGEVLGGHMITDQFAVGAVATAYSYWSVSRNPSTKQRADRQKTETYSVSLVARKFFSANNKLHFYLDARPHYQYSSDQYEAQGEFNSPVITNRLGVSLAPGVMYFLTDKIAVTAGLGNLSFDRDKQKESNVYQYRFNANFNLSYLSFGASIFFKMP